MPKNPFDIIAGLRKVFGQVPIFEDKEVDLPTPTPRTDLAPGQLGGTVQDPIQRTEIGKQGNPIGLAIADFLTGLGSGPQAVQAQQRQRAQQLAGIRQRSLQKTRTKSTEEQQAFENTIALDKLTLLKKADARNDRLIDSPTTETALSSLRAIREQPDATPLEIAQIDSAIAAVRANPKDLGPAVRTAASIRRQRIQIAGQGGVQGRFTSRQNERFRILPERLKGNEDIGTQIEFAAVNLANGKAKRSDFAPALMPFIMQRIVERGEVIVDDAGRTIINGFLSIDDRLDELEALLTESIADPANLEKTLALSDFTSGLGALIARNVFQERGAMTEQDVARATALLPSFSGTKILPELKKKNLFRLREILRKSQERFFDTEFAAFTPTGKRSLQNNGSAGRRAIKAVEGLPDF